jgi:hypothetical protein
MTISKLSGIFVLAAGIVAASLQTAAAEDAKPADPTPVLACLAAPSKVSDSVLGAFLAKPDGLLVENPTGGLPMSNQVRALSGSSDKAFDAIVGLIKTANKSQKSAIGAGLARAIAACRDSNPAFGDKMSLKVAEISDADMMVGFNAANTDIATASVPGAGGAFTGGGAVTEAGSDAGARNSTTFGGNQSRVADVVTFAAVSPNSVEDVVVNTTDTSSSPF